jgi:hypothetical protein
MADESAVGALLARIEAATMELHRGQAKDVARVSRLLGAMGSHSPPPSSPSSRQAPFATASGSSRAWPRSTPTKRGSEPSPQNSFAARYTR